MAGPSTKQALKYLEKATELKKEDLKYKKIIIISDSKGKYLRAEAAKSDIDIRIESFPSNRTSVGVTKTESILQKIPESERNKTIIIFWFLTCDVTKKEKRYISQRYASTHLLTSEIKSELEKLTDLSKKYRTDIGILEIPPIFTRIWNTYKGHPDPEKINDRPINEQVRSVNDLVEEANRTLGYKSPKLFQDLVKTSKRKGRGDKATTRTTFDPKVLADGIHPGPLIASKWTKRIIESIKRRE